MKSSLIAVLEIRKSLSQPVNAEGEGESKSKVRMVMPWALRESQRGELVDEAVQITSSLGGMRLCLRIAARVAPPSLPEQPVSANILIENMDVFAWPLEVFLRLCIVTRNRG